MQFTVNTQKDSRIQELIDPAEGGVKQPHESSDSDKGQPIVASTLRTIEDHQLNIVGLANAGWIHVKPKKGKKG